MNALCERGHDIIVYSPAVPKPLRSAAARLNERRYGTVTFTDDLNQALGSDVLTL